MALDIQMQRERAMWRREKEGKTGVVLSQIKTKQHAAFQLRTWLPTQCRPQA
jgi:hypothetical protein